MNSDAYPNGHGTVVAVSRNDVYSFTKPVRDEIVLVAGIGVEGDVHAGVHVRHRSRVRADPAQPNLRQVHLIHGELFAEVGEKGYAVTPGNLGENVTTGGIDLLGLPPGTILRFGPPRGESAAPGPDAAQDGAGQDGAGQASGDGGRSAVAEVLAAAAAAELDGPTAAAVRAVAAAAERDAGDDPRPAVIVAGLRNPSQQLNTFRSGQLKEVVDRDEEGNLVRKAGVMAVVLRGGAVRPGQAVGVELPPGPHVPLERV